MNEVSSVTEQSAVLAGSGTGRCHSYGGNHAPGDGGCGLNQRQARRAQRNGQPHQLGRNHHYEGRRPDQSAFARCRDRSRKSWGVRKGFAVVAAEIRQLADQTAVATYDIEQTVK
jgi:methyl-accepting chemotaxis protein WspA